MQFAPDSRFGDETRELVTDLQGQPGLSLLCPFRHCSVRARAEYPAQSATDQACSADAAVAGPWSGTVELRNWLFRGLLRAND